MKTLSQLETKVRFLEAELESLKLERKALRTMTHTQQQVKDLLESNAKLKLKVQDLSKKQTGINRVLRKWYPEDYS